MMNTTPPSIDDIIQRVKAEAQRQSGATEPPEPALQPQPGWEPADVPPSPEQESSSGEASSTVGPIPAPEPAGAQPAGVEEMAVSLPFRPAYYLEELLLEDGDAFIQDVYRALLGRDVDPTGLAGCRQVLASMGKLAVLDSINRSGEARARNVKLLGTALPFGLLRLARGCARAGLRLGVGRLLRVLERRIAHRTAATRALRDKMTRNRANTDARFAGIEVRFAQMNTRFGAVDARIADCERRLVEREDRLAGLEARLLALLDLQEAHWSTRRDLAMLRTAQHDQRLQVERLLQELAGLGQEQPQAASAWAGSHLADKLDLYYRAFEDANRGSAEEIRAKLAVYLPRFAALRERGLDQPVLDIGCGRGEWLQLLKEQGHAVRGVDMNPVMVAACAEQGLQAVAADACAYLRSLPDASLAAVTGFHIIEHLPFETLYGIFEQAYRVLAPGGLILFETPNPENLLVASHTFYHDFSHRNPVTPTAVSFLARYHQFGQIEIERLNPYPEEARVAGDDPLTARVNGHLCGPQDYAILARKPDLAAGEAV